MRRINSDISVVIPTCSEERWEDLVKAIESVRRQTLLPREIIVVVDHNPGLLKRIQQHQLDVTVVENRFLPGASGSRNSGVGVSSAPIVAFLDDDAEAMPDWLEQLRVGFIDEAVIGVGGTIEPNWLHGRPWWFPDEFGWVVGGSSLVMPSIRAPVRNLWSGNMSVRRDVFENVGGFRDDFGKTGSRSRPEDTEFCIRVLQMWPHRTWLFEPLARVRHSVPKQRARVRYFLTRCFLEGVGKAELTRLVGFQYGMLAERKYTMQTIPAGIVAGLVAMLTRRDIAGFGRVAAIGLGFSLAALGYLRGISTIGIAHEMVGTRGRIPEKRIA